MAKAVQASVSDYSNFSQELRLSDDDSRDGDGEFFMLPELHLLIFVAPDNPQDGPDVFFFSSLRLPPATPPPISA